MLQAANTDPWVPKAQNNKPKMVNATEGLNQVILEGEFYSKKQLFCPKPWIFLAEICINLEEHDES